MNNRISRKVITDEPTKTDSFNGKGHERTAASLARAIEAFDGVDRAIGLDGAWGSGKSSVVEIAASSLQSGRGNGTRFHFFTFDIWKSQGAGFRRSFLEHFVSWAKDSFPSKKAALQEIEKDIRGRTKEIETNNRPILDFFGIAVLLALPTLPIFYFWSRIRLEAFWENLAEDSTLWDSWIGFFAEPPITILALFLISAFLVALKKFNSDRSLGFKGALSTVLLVSSKQHQDHKVIQRVREVDPNDYEFHKTLRQILAIIQSKRDKVVLVLDNIDRLPHDEIKEYWALVRSIFSRTHQITPSTNSQSITAIVPYDRKLIENAVSDALFNDATNESITNLPSRELFSKTFDEVLTVSPPVLSNARDFFSEKISEALGDAVSHDERFLAYRIFVEILRSGGGTTTPRQVVSFVNEVSGLYVLHNGEFKLPTIAAFLAHQDMISNDPKLLTDLTNLDEKIVELAADDDLPKHLAAIIFNVDKELAYQVLLDEPLAAAMVASDSEALRALMDAPGFDLRADDVLKSNLSEWIGTSEYQNVLVNFADALPSYQRSARTQIVKALTSAFKDLESFELEQNTIQALLRIFDVAPEDEKVAVLDVFVEAGFNGADREAENDYERGAKFAGFLGQANDALKDKGFGEAFKAALKGRMPDTNPDFLYGLAVGVSETGLSLKSFKAVSLKAPTEGHYPSEIAVKDPMTALAALRQFKTVRCP
ncbi:MAG: P-loop NTPase fold protein [Pseudomonadota bacterium]